MVITGNKSILVNSTPFDTAVLGKHLDRPISENLVESGEAELPMSSYNVLGALATRTELLQINFSDRHLINICSVSDAITT